jgi:endonuclease G
MMGTVQLETLRAACQARDLAAAYYLLNPRVTLIDVGWRIQEGEITEELAVRFHVRDKPTGFQFEAFSEQNPDLVIDPDKIPFPVDFPQAVYPLHWYPYPYRAQPPPRGYVFETLRGGISISNEYGTYGTLGGIVRDRDTDEDMVLSNWHVLGGEKGVRIYQPGSADGGQFEHTIAFLERHVMDRGIDAAVAKLSATRPWINDQFEVAPVSGVVAPSLNMRVVKSGRGSGVTKGVIDGFEGEYPIEYGGLPRKIKHVFRIVPVTKMGEVSRPGDSGSWWLEKDSNKTAGLHFAGSDYPEEAALAIAMPQVLEALNVRIPVTA